MHITSVMPTRLDRAFNVEVHITKTWTCHDYESTFREWELFVLGYEARISHDDEAPLEFAVSVDRHHPGVGGLPDFVDQAMFTSLSEAQLWAETLIRTHLEKGNF